jgi:hypothetical protein
MPVGRVRTHWRVVNEGSPVGDYPLAADGTAMPDLGKRRNGQNWAWMMKAICAKRNYHPIRADAPTASHWKRGSTQTAGARAPHDS